MQDWRNRMNRALLLRHVGCAVRKNKAILFCGSESQQPPKTTKPGWFARLSTCGTGPLDLVSTAGPECQNLGEPCDFQSAAFSRAVRSLSSLTLRRGFTGPRRGTFTSPSPGFPVRASAPARHTRPSRRGPPHRALLWAKPHSRGPLEIPGAAPLPRRSRSCPPGANRS
jgi:hypothetical protein